tara:strand:- start:411 stop:2321 length:1911 start_codon:yes stop_codon:yes gene_type:complete
MSKIWHKIQGSITAADSAKSIDKRKWELAQMFLEGRQHISYDRNLAKYVTARAQAGKQQVTINLILNIYRNIVARLTTAYPSIRIVPASPLADDIVKAKASETAIRYWWQQSEMKQVLQKCIQDLLICGNAGLFQFYDPDAKEVKIRHVSPYDFFFEKNSSGMEDSTFVAIRSYVTKEQLQEDFPNKAEELQGVSYATNTTSQYTHPVPEDRVELYETYLLKGKDKGRYALMVGSTVLFEGRTPDNIIPFQHIRYTSVPDKMWGMSLIYPLIELQALYNKARALVMENAAVMTNPKWLIPTTAGVSPNAITSQPGEKIFYNPAGGVPQQIGMAPMPGYVFQNISSIQQEMLDISGIHSTTLGKRTVGIQSGKAIQAIAEQDLSQLVFTQNNIEYACKDVAEVVLTFMKAFYKESKMTRMLDAYGGIIFKEVKNTDYVDTPEVFIESGSLFQHQAEGKDKKVLEMLQLQLITKEEAMAALSFSTGSTFALEKMAAMTHAQQILEAAIEGAEVEVYATDDLQVFQKVFADFMRLPDFYNLEQERQDYLSDVFVSMVEFSQALATGKQSLRDKVFPSIPKGSDESSIPKIALNQQSPVSSTQVLEEAADGLQVQKMVQAANSLRAVPNSNLEGNAEGGV